MITILLFACGAIVLGGGVYYLAKERNGKASGKICSAVPAVGGAPSVERIAKICCKRDLACNPFREVLAFRSNYSFCTINHLQSMFCSAARFCAGKRRLKAIAFCSCRTLLDKRPRAPGKSRGPRPFIKKKVRRWLIAQRRTRPRSGRKPRSR